MDWISHKIEEQIKITEFFSLFKHKFKNKYNFPGETHDFWECVYVLDGKVYASADERVYTLGKGKIIFHKPLELHKLYVDNPSGATLLIFSFSASGVLCDFLKDKVFSLSAAQQNIIIAMLNFISHNIKTKGTFAIENFFSPIDTNPLYLQTVATYIMQLILSLAENPTESIASTHPDAKTFKKAVHYMNKNIYKNLTVSDIAKYCNSSSSTIKRIFDKYAGIPIHQYFLKLKMQKATIMLKSGTNVSDTAEKLNFCSQAYFSKAYKRETGFSPSELKHKR